MGSEREPDLRLVTRWPDGQVAGQRRETLRADVEGIQADWRVG